MIDATVAVGAHDDQIGPDPGRLSKDHLTDTPLEAAQPNIDPIPSQGTGQRLELTSLGPQLPGDFLS
jgi:hypothetical protein